MVSLLIFDPSVVVGFVLVLAAAWRWFAVPADARRTEYILLIAIFTLLVSPAAQVVADSMSGLRPMKMDLFVYVADGYLGQPAFVLGRVVAPHPWAKVLLNVAYGMLPIGVIVTLSAHILRRSTDVGAMVWAFVINLLVAPLIYLLVPVCGPKFAFPMFPLDAGHVIPHMVAINAAPNGIPSVHTSTALLLVWFCRKSRAGLVLAMAYLLLMVMATLASGQHYGVDLLAAVPYAAGVGWLGKVVAGRWALWVARRMQISHK
jgi:PAP2 superfamily